ncbi:hypothetical protein HY546_03665 [archaeon]|nr:hypothetical protein [archaeon]
MSAQHHALWQAFTEDLLRLIRPEEEFHYGHLITRRGSSFARFSNEPRAVRAWLATEALKYERTRDGLVCFAHEDSARPVMYHLSPCAIALQSMARAQHAQPRARKGAQPAASRVLPSVRAEAAVTSQRRNSGRGPLTEDEKRYRRERAAAVRRSEGRSVRVFLGVPQPKQSGSTHKAVPFEVHVQLLYVLTCGRAFLFASPPAYTLRKDKRSLKTLIRQLEEQGYVRFVGTSDKRRVHWTARARTLAAEVMKDPAVLERLTKEYEQWTTVRSMPFEVRARILCELTEGQPFPVEHPPEHIRLAGLGTPLSFAGFIRTLVQRGWLVIDAEVVAHWREGAYEQLAVPYVRTNAAGSINGLFANLFNQFRLLQLIYRTAGFEWLGIARTGELVCEHFELAAIASHHVGRALGRLVKPGYLERRQRHDASTFWAKTADYRVTPGGLQFIFKFEEARALEDLRARGA